MLTLFRPVVQELQHVRCIHSTAALCFRMTDTVCAVKGDPSKKKKRRFEKELRRYEKYGEKSLKPVEEFEVPVKDKRELAKGLRVRNAEPFTSDELEEHMLLHKAWTRYKIKHHVYELGELKRVRLAQEKALNKLREESEDLYQQAIQLDTKLLPSTFEGPMHTLPIDDYLAQDGKHMDITNYFENESLFTDIEENFATQRKKRK